MHRVFNKNLLLGYESILDYDSILLNELAHPWLKYGFSTIAKTNLSQMWGHFCLAQWS